MFHMFLPFWYDSGIVKIKIIYEIYSFHFKLNTYNE